MSISTRVHRCSCLPRGFRGGVASDASVVDDPLRDSSDFLDSMHLGEGESDGFEVDMEEATFGRDAVMEMTAGINEGEVEAPYLLIGQVRRVGT